MTGAAQKTRMSLDRGLAAPGRISASHRHMSLAFLVVWLILVLFGLLTMFSASYGISFIQSGAEMKTSLDQAGELDEASPVRAILEADATALARKQALLTLIGTSAAIGLGALVRFRQLTRPVLRLIVYLAVTASLLYCLLGGVVINGAKRWVYLGPIRFQPSELAKIGAVFFLAGYFSRRKAIRHQEAHSSRVRTAGGGPGQRTGLARQAFLDVTLPGLLMSVWVGLTLVQPHLSGAVIIALISLTVFFIADIPMKSRITGLLQLLVILVALAVVLGAGYQLLTRKSAVNLVTDRFAHAYRRVGTFQDRESANLDDRLQIEQAELALGSGGLTGKGIGKSVQKLNWLSEAHNDFILPVIGEELGFIGVVSVILLFLAFLVTGILVARRAGSHMAMLVAAGNTILIALQAFLNMAVAVSLIPTTGISLPFFSYGGTASLFFALSSGLVLCVSKSASRTDPRLAGIVDKRSARGGGAKKRKNRLEEDDAMRYAV